MKENRRLKIGIFMDSFYPAVDGVVVVIDNLAKMLAKFNDVTVIVPETPSENEDFKRPYNIIRVKSIPIPFTEYKLGRNFSKRSKTFKKLVNEKFDIVHIHSPFTVGKLGLKVAHALNVPCVATLHTRFDFEIRKIVNNKHIVNMVIKDMMKVFNACDVATTVNKPMIQVFKDFGYVHEPVIIPNGTELTPLEDKENSIKMVNKLYDLSASETIFLFVGRITDVKNIFFILDSLKLLKEDGIKFKMLYVGTGPDEKKLKEKIKEYNMEDSVIMTGRIMDRILLSAIYARADLFLFPSLFDTSSLVQVEAAVNETPGLFIEGSVTAYTVTNNVSGFTTELDVNKYKDRIKEIINDKKLLAKVSKNAREMLGKNWSTIALEAYDLYIKEIEKKKSN